MKLSPETQPRSEKLHSLSRPSGPRRVKTAMPAAPRGPRRRAPVGTKQVPVAPHQSHGRPPAARACHCDSAVFPTVLPGPGITELRHSLALPDPCASVDDLRLQWEAWKLGFLGMHFRVLSRQLGGLISMAGSLRTAGELSPQRREDGVLLRCLSFPQEGL